MEVLLLFTIFLDVQLIAGWSPTIPENSRTPKAPGLSLFAPIQKFLSLLKPAQKYAPAPGRQTPPAIAGNFPRDNALAPFRDDSWLDYDMGVDLWGTSTKPESPNCVSTAVVASGLTAIIIVSIFTLIFKVIPSLFVSRSSSSLQMLANAAVQSWMPERKYTPPNVHNYPWPPVRNYGGNSYLFRTPRGRYSPLRRARNSQDYQ